jgi:predicted Fe-Mo cluster-binding NifX family protein
MAVVALPIYRRRIAPAFDFTRKVLIVDLRTEWVHGTGVSLQGLTPNERVETLSRAGVTTLICGGISDGVHDMLKNRGMEVIWGIAGPVNEVLQAYRSGHLAEARFQMPGRGANVDSD